MHRIIAKNTLVQLFGRIFSSGTSFLIRMVIARELGVFGYGEFAKVVAFVSLFYLFVDFGFNAIFLQKEDSRRRFNDLLYMRLGFSLMLILLINGISIVLPYNAITQVGFSPDARIGIAIFSLTLIAEAIFYTASAVFQRELIYVKLMISSVSASIVTLIGVLFALHTSLGLHVVYIFFVFGGVVEGALCLVFANEKIQRPRLDVRFSWQLIRETLPVMLMLVFNLLYFRIDTFLLSFFRTSSDVGIYDLAYNFFDFLIALPLFLVNAFYPFLLEKKKNMQIARINVFRYVGFFFILGCFVALPAFFLAPFLGLIQPGLAASALPLRILLFGLPVFFATSILQWVLIAYNKQRFLVWVYFLFLVGNLLANLIFLPAFGYVASAVITDLGELGIFLVFLFFLRRLSFL